MSKAGNPSIEYRRKLFSTKYNKYNVTTSIFTRKIETFYLLC